MRYIYIVDFKTRKPMVKTDVFSFLNDCFSKKVGKQTYNYSKRNDKDLTLYYKLSPNKHHESHIFDIYEGMYQFQVRVTDLTFECSLYVCKNFETPKKLNKELQKISNKLQNRLGYSMQNLQYSLETKSLQFMVSKV